jgi:transcriptional regulator GlxA family with amidase domain
VQAFRYRGSSHICLPGQLSISHPDETYDGGPATDDGLGYRIIYVAPELIRQALDGEALPFVADPVAPSAPTTRLLALLRSHVDEPMSELGGAAAVVVVADTLRELSGRREWPRHRIDEQAVELVREYLVTHAREQTPAAVLEQIAGIDRFTMARAFRQAFGTSPDRYRALRRLDIARTLIQSGQSLARAGIEAGFADQSHMTRQFTKTFGLSPGHWAKAVGAGRGRDDARARQT